MEPDERLTDDELGGDLGGDYGIPASELYEVWNNLQVNPYKVSPDSLLSGDSININLKNFTFPLLKHYRVTSEFGHRRYRFHYGIDLKVNRGDTVVSVLDGMVRIAKRMAGYGNFVVVRHYNGMESFYGHLSKILVKPDQQVKSGEIIGLGGNTGRSTGPHLHLELRYLGLPINPRDMIDFDSLCAKNDFIQLSRSNFSYRYGPQSLKALKAAQTKAAKAASAKTTSKTATNVSSTPKTSTTSQTSSTNISGSRIYTVKDGDSLWLIAQSTGVSIKQLCAINEITSKTVIKPGRKLKY